MTGIRIGVLGRATVVVDGRTVVLTPLTLTLLLRLVAAEGVPVPVLELYRDVWGREVPKHLAEQRACRTEVQKRVRELRVVLQNGRVDGGILQTVELVAEGRKYTAYRLELGDERVDVDAHRFRDLVNLAMRSSVEQASVALSDALSLWRGRPLAEAGDAAWARTAVRQLSRQGRHAWERLTEIRVEQGRYRAAIEILEQVVARKPDDKALAQLEKVRALESDRRNTGPVCREFPHLGTKVTVVVGNLFDQDDAHLVVGFSDTFDTSTESDLVISRDSVQGQLVARLFEGDPKLLDARLAEALHGVPVQGIESRETKRLGNLVRYPVGTVVHLVLDWRRVFAVAYSRLGNNLVAQADPAELEASLVALWASVTQHGALKPVAIPLVGTSLSRLKGHSPGRSARMIVDTFLRSCQDNPQVARELRIVVRPGKLDAAVLSEIDAHLAGWGALAEVGTHEGEARG